MQIHRLSPPRVKAFLGSTIFFKAIISLFIIQAAWIALSGRYPMAFDEDFHLGIIRLYADHFSPFWNGHPFGADAFGPVARDPSYLFHYLFSLPYRLLDVVGASQAVIIVTLRFINIGLFTWGLVLFRRLLAKTKAPASMINLSLLVFILIPIVPLLAAHINYDNLMMPLTAIALLLTVRFTNAMKRSVLDVKTLMQLMAICLLASLVKYPFLPIFAVIFVFTKYRAWRTFHSFGQVGQALLRGWKKVSSKLAWTLLAGVLLASGLFIERYGINLVRYHSPSPDCAQVLTIEQCQSYGPWARDYGLAAQNKGEPRDTAYFVREWFQGMWFRTYFSLAGPTTGYETRGPLTLPALGGIAFAAIGVLALIVAGRAIRRRYRGNALALLTAVTAIYTLVVIAQQYELYRYSGLPVALNARYLLPVLPFYILGAGLAINEVLGKRQPIKIIMATLIVLCSLWGGGALTYILRSNDTWYWPATPLKSTNHAIQKYLGPLTPGYSRPTQFIP